MALDFPLQFKRQYAGPLDENSVFTDEAALQDYIANSGIAYAGQQVALVDGTEFVIYQDGQGLSYKPSGGSIAGNVVETADRTIYVQAADDPIYPGSDETGDGTTVETAFATIDRAFEELSTIQNSIIYIELGEGTFTINSTYLDELKNSKFLAIRGKMVDVVTGVTVTTREDSIFRYDVLVDGTDPEWAIDEHAGRFLYNSRYGAYPYVPIESNESNIVEYAFTSNPELASKISEIRTTINIASNSFNNPFGSQIRLYNLYVTSPDDRLFLYGSALASMYQCSLPAIIHYSAQILHIAACHARNGMRSSSPAGIKFSMVVAKHSGYYGLNAANVLQLTNVIFNIPAHRDALVAGHVKVNSTAGFTVRFKQCDACFWFNDSAVLSYSIDYKVVLELVNVNHLFGTYRPGAIALLKKDHINGTPKVGWTTFSKAYWQDNSSSIYVEGIMFVPAEINLSQLLTHNTTTHIPVGNKTQNRSIIIDYVLERNGRFEEGQHRVLFDGTNLLFTSSGQDNQAGAGIGVSFAFAFDDTDPDIINMQATLDGSADDATLTYDVQRKMR